MTVHPIHAVILDHAKICQTAMNAFVEKDIQGHTVNMVCDLQSKLRCSIFSKG